MEIYFSARKYWLLISCLGCFASVVCTAQTIKPEIQNHIEFPRPGVDNQQHVDSLKRTLDFKRKIKRQQNLSRNKRIIKLP